MDVRFSPILHDKNRGYNRLKCSLKSLPILSGDRQIKAVFNGICAQVPMPHGGEQLRNCGCFGEVENYDDNVLLLSLEEAFFLSYFLEVLVLLNEDDPMHWQQLLEIALVMNANFIQSFAAYLYLRSQGWIVKSGIKFGGNFLVYKNGPNFYHASFVVVIEGDSAIYTFKDFTGYLRISETARKDLLVLNVIQPRAFQLTILSDFGLFEVSETVIRRLSISSFVQQEGSQKHYT